MKLISTATTSREPSAGFTLIELMVVCLLIGIIAAVAFPQLMPAITFSRLEGAARHLVGYGRSAVAYCTLMREPITVKFDLETQEYWAVTQIKRSSSLFDDDEEESEKPTGPADMLEFLSSGEVPDQAELLQNGADLLRERFDEFARRRMETLSNNVEREGILDEIGPLFDHEFALDEEEEEYEEVADPLLIRTKLPEGVLIEAIRIGESRHSQGEVQVELSPLGLYSPVVFFLKNEDDDYFTVAWDPISGSAHLREGKEDILDLD